MTETFEAYVKACYERNSKAQGILKMQSLLMDELENTLNECAEDNKFTHSTAVSLKFKGCTMENVMSF